MISVGVAEARVARIEHPKDAITFHGHLRSPSELMNELTEKAYGEVDCDRQPKTVQEINAAPPSARGMVASEN